MKTNQTSEAAGQRWTTTEVVQMTGVTSRTLRHYDAEGIVVPVGVGAGGVRLYGRDELLRLQQVLLLRELGLGLPAVRQVVEGTTDPAAALRDHRQRLVAEREHIDRLVATVDRTIKNLEGDEEMSEEQLFDGFDPKRQKGYERELVEHWGVSQDVIDTSRVAVRSMSKDELATLPAQWSTIEESLALLMDDGAAPDHDRVTDALVSHWELTARLWGRAPSAEAYAGLGVMYVEHPEFRQRYDAIRPGFAQWLCDALAAYALARLT